jgi:hypothetical protein
VNRPPSLIDATGGSFRVLSGSFRALQGFSGSCGRGGLQGRVGQRQEFAHSKSESVELAGWKFEGVSRRSATGISPEPSLVRVHGFVRASGGFRRHSMHGGDATEPIDEGDVDVDQAALHPVPADAIAGVDEQHRGSRREVRASTHAPGATLRGGGEFDVEGFAFEDEADPGQTGGRRTEKGEPAGVRSRDLFRGEPVSRSGVRVIGAARG